VFRDGRTRSIDVTLGARPLPRELARAASRSRDEAYGAVLSPLTPQIAQRLGVEMTRGIVVREDTPLSPAAEAGRAVGEIILTGGEADVDEPAEAIDAIRQADATEGVRLHIRRGDQRRFIVLVPPRQDD
jgi:serine protease Do